MIFEGKVSTVLVFKIDRHSRSLRGGLDVLYRWLESGVRIVSTTQGFDFSGTVGKMIASHILGVAEIEHELRYERQRAGIEIAKSKGVYQGRKAGTEVSGKTGFSSFGTGVLVMM
jgi:DNA invertase Pin-like site-specific DNA recombinase